MTKTEEESDKGCNEKLKSTFTVSLRNSLRKRLSTAKERIQGIDRSKLGIGIISLILVCLVAGVTVASRISQTSIANSGTVEVIGVSLYWDNACQNEVKSIAWGPIYPGTSIDRYVYVKNQGNTAEMLTMSYSNFIPSMAASYFSLVWNCSGYVLSLTDVPCAKLTLSVRQNITGVQDFSFGIVVQATA